MNYIEINNDKHNSEDFTDYIIIDWKNNITKESLLEPFYEAFELYEYKWSSSLDTFEDIISDPEFIKTKKVKILIRNFNCLLLWDPERKNNFYDILCKCLIKTNSNIMYQISIFL